MQPRSPQPSGSHPAPGSPLKHGQGVPASGLLERVRAPSQQLIALGRGQAFGSRRCSAALPAPCSQLSPAPGTQPAPGTLRSLAPSSARPGHRAPAQAPPCGGFGRLLPSVHPQLCPGTPQHPLWRAPAWASLLSHHGFPWSPRPACPPPQPAALQLHTRAAKLTGNPVDANPGLKSRPPVRARNFSCNPKRAAGSKHAGLLAHQHPASEILCKVSPGAGPEDVRGSAGCPWPGRGQKAGRAWAGFPKPPPVLLAGPVPY